MTENHDIETNIDFNTNNSQDRPNTLSTETESQALKPSEIQEALGILYDKPTHATHTSEYREQCLNKDLYDKELQAVKEWLQTHSLSEQAEHILILRRENDTLRQYRGSKQASYQSMEQAWQECEHARIQLEKQITQFEERERTYNQLLGFLLSNLSLNKAEFVPQQEISQEPLVTPLSKISDAVYSTEPNQSEVN